MGVTFTFELAIGFQIKQSDLLAPFTRHFEEVSHMEDRFDSKTGKKLNPAKIVDEAEYDTVTIDGKEVESYEAGELIADKLECHIWENDDGDEESEFYVFGPEYQGMKDGFDGGNISAYGATTYGLLMSLDPQLKELRGRLSKLLGVDPGEPVVKVVWNVG